MRNILKRAYKFYIFQLYIIRSLYSKRTKDFRSISSSLSFFLFFLNIFSLLILGDYFLKGELFVSIWESTYDTPRVIYGILIGVLLQGLISIILLSFRKIQNVSKISIIRKLISSRASFKWIGFLYLCLSLLHFSVGFFLLMEVLT